MGDPGEKTVPRMVKFRKQRFRFEHVIFKRFHIKGNNGKWSSQKFQGEQINEKFGVAFSDGDICIFCYNINVGSIPLLLF
jgi:hypothetical protein